MGLVSQDENQSVALKPRAIHKFFSDRTANTGLASLSPPDINSIWGADGLNIKPTLRNDRIIVVDDRAFLAECLKMSLEASLAMPVDIYHSISAVVRPGPSPKLILISIDNLKESDVPECVRRTCAMAPSVPIVVLSYWHHLRVIREIMDNGVKGYLPMTMGFDIAIEAVKSVLAGGTYIPPECIAVHEENLGPRRTAAAERITERESAVIQAIHQGKSNKIIAYELGMCESTVKVHIRNVMRKLKAKNRTEIAVRTTEIPLLAGFRKSF